MADLKRFTDRFGRLFGSRPAESLPQETLEELRQVEAVLGHRFSDLELLQRALTHRSFVFEGEPGDDDDEADYEAMEFLGDAILSLVVSEALYERFPQREGVLSRIRSYLVSRRQLSQLSRNLALGRFIRLSRGEENTGGREKKAILADLFESAVAAIYLDGGLEPARRFILAQFEPLIEQIDSDQLDVRDHKSRLQEYLHAMSRSEPGYKVTEEMGPDHDKEFVVEVRSNGETLGEGRGGSKKEAEQHAARRALQTLRNRD